MIYSPDCSSLRLLCVDAFGLLRSRLPLFISTLLMAFAQSSVAQEYSWDFDSEHLWQGGEGSRFEAARIYMHGAPATSQWAPSPRINLLAGETYTVGWDARQRDLSSARTLGVMLTNQPGAPTDLTGQHTFVVDSDVWERSNTEFTVSSDGSYYITFFTQKNYVNSYLDNVSIVGNFNVSPYTTWSGSSGSVRTIEGATVQLEVDTIDPDGSVLYVDFVDENGALLAPDARVNTPPYSYAWTPSNPGNYIVKARAYDDDLGFGDSASRAVTVESNHYSLSTHLGDSATDDVITGMAYLSDGTLVIGGILNPSVFPGATPTYLNGASIGDRGFVARLSEDGQTLLSLSIISDKVVDLDIDGADRIYAAAWTEGVVVLDSTGSLLFSQAYPSVQAHRVDAANGGTFGVLVSSQSNYRDPRVSEAQVHLYDSNFSLLSTMEGASFNTTDLAIDETTQTVGLIGWRNFYTLDPDNNNFPVDVPSVAGRDFTGNLKYRAYNWGDQTTGDSYLNRRDNNMADTRGARIVLGPNGRFYAGIEFDGGNTPLRYDPFDLDVNVTSKIVGGDLTTRPTIRTRSLKCL